MSQAPIPKMTGVPARGGDGKQVPWAHAVTTWRESLSSSVGGPVRASQLLPPRLLPTSSAVAVERRDQEVLADQLGVPATVGESQRLGRAAVLVMLQIAGSCPAAVLDSTWFDYTQPLLAALPGALVEVRGEVPLEVARARYSARADLRHAGPLHQLRSESELWGHRRDPRVWWAQSWWTPRAR